MATHKHTRKKTTLSTIEHNADNGMPVLSPAKNSVEEVLQTSGPVSTHDTAIGQRRETPTTIGSNTTHTALEQSTPTLTALPTPAEPTQSVKAQKRTETQMSESISLLEYSVDIAEVEAPPPLPPSIYPATIEGAEPKVSAAKGNRYLSLLLRISADNYPADFEGDPDGLVLSYNRVMIQDTPMGRYRMKKLCELCGVIPSQSIDPNDFVGLTVNVATGINEYEGEKRTEIQRIVGHD